MSVTVEKGEKVSLNKEAPGIHTIFVGLGWETNIFDGTDFDLDAEVFLLDERGKVPSDECFIFYHNRKSEDGSVEHMGSKPFVSGN